MKDRPVDRYHTVDEYIAYQDTSLQPMLQKMRAIIRSAAPHAEECISYMIPCYKYHGMLVGFGTHKKGCSFYTMNPAILRSYTSGLKDLKYTGSTIHFDPGKALPAALIKQLTKHRIKENEERDALKKMMKQKK